PEIQTAVMSSASQHVKTLLRDVLADPAKQPTPDFLHDLVKLAVWQTNETAALEIFASALSQDTQSERGFAAIAGFLDGLDQRKLALTALPGESIALVHSKLASARELVNSSSASEDLRLAAMRLLGRDSAHRDEDLMVLGKLLEPSVSPTLQGQALAQIRRSGQNRAADVLLDHWPHASPARRADILNALLGRSEWVDTLLGRVEAGKILPAELGTPFQQKLLSHSETALRERAQKLFSAKRTDRKALLREYARVDANEGNPARGAELFKQQCALCHKFKGDGVDLGPDLGALATKTVDVLLV